MATKAKVMAVLKKQGIIPEFDGFEFYASLPDGFVWQNGFDCGSVTQEKYDGETWAEFWDNVLMIIDAPIVKEGN